MTPDDAEATYQALVHQNRVVETSGAAPLAKNCRDGKADEGQAQIPPLITLYMEFGAKVLARPAYDPIFKCYDLLVFFDMEFLSSWGTDLLEKFDRRYGHD